MQLLSFCSKILVWKYIGAFQLLSKLLEVFFFFMPNLVVQFNHQHVRLVLFLPSRSYILDLDEFEPLEAQHRAHLHSLEPDRDKPPRSSWGVMIYERLLSLNFSPLKVHQSLLSNRVLTAVEASRGSSFHLRTGTWSSQDKKLRCLMVIETVWMSHSLALNSLGIQLLEGWGSIKPFIPLMTLKLE